jgi:iron(III) transport system substrate-binding protein
MRRSAILVALSVFLGCTSSNKQTLTIYSPHGKELLTEFEKQYEALHTQVDVQWLDMGSQDAYDRIRTERENPQADIWWGAPSTIFAKAEAEGLLEQYIPTWDSSVPSEFKSPRGYWYGTFITPEVIMYNNRLLSEEAAPKDWDDLLDARWKDKIIIRYPLASGTMRIIFAALIQREMKRTGDVTSGFDWLRRLDANTKTYTADPTQLYLKIAREEGLVTLWDLPDVIIQSKLNGYPFGYIIPKSGTPLITDCIAIVKGTKNPAQAREFYEFVTSVKSMVQQAREFYRIPTRKDIPVSELPSWLTQLKLLPMNVDWKSLSQHEKEWMKYWDENIKGTGKK